MLFLAETSTLYSVIGVAGVAVIILYSLGVAFVTLWLFSEADFYEEGRIFVTGFGIWIFGSAAILFITTTIQKIL